jgi:uncharacterized protein YfaQ (DUF2300 family)
MVHLNNRLTLDEFEEWVGSGKSMKDAACGLMFEAARLAQTTEGWDRAIPVYLQLAQTCATLEVAEWVQEINLRVGK